MYSYPGSHPLDTDLLDFVEEVLNEAASHAIERHLASCLLCRIKRQRLTGVAPIELTDVRNLSSPEFGAIEIVEAPGTAARRGELWLSASDDASMVLVRTVRDNDYGIVVVPVTLDVEVADSGALILDTSASPLAIPIAVYDRLAVSLPSSALSGRVMPLRSDVDLLTLTAGQPGVSRGSALEGPADPRLEVRQYLSDRLVALESYETDPGSHDPPSSDADNRRSDLQDELILRRGSGCQVEELGLLPSLPQTPQTWSGFACVKDFIVRIIVIDTPSGLNDERDYVCAQALLTRLDGSALVVCRWQSDSADLFDPPTLFHAIELPDGKRATKPFISGLSLVDTIAKFLEQKRSVISAIAPSGSHAVRVDVQEILAEEVAGAVEATLGRASRLGQEKRAGYMALAGKVDGLTEVLKTALEIDFDPQSILVLLEGEDP
jgi:hypothetical protein